MYGVKIMDLMQPARRGLQCRRTCLVHNYMDARPVSQPWSLKCTVRDALFRCFVTGCEDRCEAAAAAQVDESL